MCMPRSRQVRCSTSKTLSPSENVTVVVSRMMPSEGTIPFLDSFTLSMLSRIVLQVMEIVQVYFVDVSTSASSGSAGAGFPSGTGSVWYLSFPVEGSISCLPLVEGVSCALSNGVVSSGFSVSVDSSDGVSVSEGVCTSSSCGGSGTLSAGLPL